MPFTLKEQPIVDAEFVEVTPDSGPAPVQQLHTDMRDRNIVDLRLGADAGPIQMELYARRARAVSLFVELPLLTIVALHDKSPGLIRLGAAILAAWKAVELARGGAIEVQATGEDWVQEWREQ